MKRIAPGIRKGLSLIIDLLTEEKIKAGQELPPSGELADKAGLSRVTMLKALKEMVAMGVLEGMQGTRYRLAENGIVNMAKIEQQLEESHKPVVARQSWEAAAERIKRDRASGLIQPGDTHILCQFSIRQLRTGVPRRGLLPTMRLR